MAEKNGGESARGQEERIAAVRASLKAAANVDRERERERVRDKHKEQKRKRKAAEAEANGDHGDHGSDGDDTPGVQLSGLPDSDGDHGSSDIRRSSKTSGKRARLHEEESTGEAALDDMKRDERAAELKLAALLGGKI